jgi:uncharacterized protein YjdB
VVGNAPGVATVSYTVSGCGSVTTSVTVNAAPGPISGPGTLCVGSTITLTDSVAGGSWSTSGTSIATIGSATGIVTGVAAGTVTVYYLVGGCGTYKILTVTAAPAAISGYSTVCVGSPITLSDATAGGTWASAATSVATVGSTTGIVTGVAAGTSTIYYSVPGCGGTYKIVTVTAAPAAITGSSSVCVGSNITLSDATTGGTWSSSSTAIAYVTSIGVVVGNAAGVATISYTVSGCGSVIKSVTVNAAPAPVSGPSTLCSGSTITLTDSVAGGTWSSANTAVATVGSTSGVVTGIAAGTTTIYYFVGSCVAYKVVTVTASPAAISGSSTVCVGSSITLSDATAGGTWASAATSVATVGSATGVVTGVTAGTSTIYYSVPGCGGAYKIVTVTAAPATITGSSSICVGGYTTLADATSGGAWLSSPTSVATVGATSGVVHGVAAGVATISYYISGCGIATKSVTVNPGAGVITGASTLCIGYSITLTDSVAGGTWSTSGTSVVTIGSATGIITGIAAGTVNVYYLVGGCGTYKILTVTASPAAISGSSTLCVGSAITLSDATAGGTWASAASSLATVGSTTGVVTGVAAGTSTIYYSVPGCGGAYKIVTVTAAPAAITGSSSICVGSYTTLADATGGGAWLSSPTSIATVGATSGVVHGVAAGVATISYYISGCGIATKSVTVHTAPSITGATSFCVGGTTSLSATVSGGSWISSNTSIATVGSTSGVVSGVAVGTATIYYAGVGCSTYKIVTVSTCTGGIGGGIYTGSPKGTSSSVPVVGMMVRLKYAATNAILTQTYTDASGQYLFSGLADDEYYVYPESVGYTTTPSATLALSGSATIYNNINFKVDDGAKTIAPVTTSVYQQQAAGTINVYPNPAKGTVYIGWTGQSLNGATVLMTDVTGRQVGRKVISNNGNSGEDNIDVSGLAAGVYFIAIESESINYRSGLLIQQ